MGEALMPPRPTRASRSIHRKNERAIVFRGPDVILPGNQSKPRVASETIDPKTGRTVELEIEVPVKPKVKAPAIVNKKRKK